jgi:RNA polymerase sigma factor (sigma-70 family)
MEEIPADLRPELVEALDPSTSSGHISTAIAAVWRQQSARVVAGLTRMTRDLGVAEDLAHDALVQALEQWPHDGVPDNPGAWLMSTAKRRAVDYFRHNEVVRRKTAELGRDLEEVDMPDLIGGVDRIEDDVLRLIFLTCHPALPAESRAALTLRLVGGLTTSEIARGFLVKDITIGQRISRAKRTLAEVRADFEMPGGDERVARLEDVMGVIYLIFNEGFAATTGPDWTRPDLCADAIRLARMLAELMPSEPDVHGLQALLELQASRLPARAGNDGIPVLLETQDRARWDQLLIRRGLAALARAEALNKPVGPYVIQAAIAAGHARAGRVEETDWGRMASLYDLLAQAAPSPVVEVNRAIARGRASGPEAGLRILEPLAGEPVLASSPMLASVRGDLLERAGRTAEAAAEFRAAAALSRNDAERNLLLRRAEETH